MYKSANKKATTILMPIEVGDGRIESILKIFQEVKNKNELILDWSKVEKISPAGFAILACLFDSTVEAQTNIEHINIQKKLKLYPVIQNLINSKKHQKLPDPSINNYSDSFITLRGKKTLDIEFINQVLSTCGKDLSEELAFSCKLISNELMQNSLAHSGSERFYIYAGRWNKDFHIGVLDMGVTIPAKLEQKYLCQNDFEYLELSLKEGTSTRRERTGGLGLNHVFILLKDQLGRLTILSRKAQVRRYFKRRVIVKGKLKYTLNGTWCFARFPFKSIDGDKK